MVTKLQASRSAGDEEDEEEPNHVNTGCRASIDPKGWLGTAVVLQGYKERLAAPLGQPCSSLLICWHALYTLSTGKVLNKCGCIRQRSVFPFVVWFGGVLGFIKISAVCLFLLV